MGPWSRRAVRAPRSPRRSGRAASAAACSPRSASSRAARSEAARWPARWRARERRAVEVRVTPSALVRSSCWATNDFSCEVSGVRVVTLARSRWSSRSRGSHDSATARSSWSRVISDPSASRSISSAVTPSTAHTPSTWPAVRSSASPWSASAVSRRSASGSTGAARRCASREAARSSASAAEASSFSSSRRAVRPRPRASERARAASSACWSPATARVAASRPDRRWASSAVARVSSDAAHRSSEPSAASGSRSCRSHPSGVPTPAASWIRLTTPAARSWWVWHPRRSSTRRSTSQRSTSSKRRVRKSRWSTPWRSEELARRKAWNRPWGSIATWVNWVQVMPSSPVTSCPASSSRLVSAIHSSPRRSSTTTWAWTRVVPLAAALGSLPGGGAGEPERAAAHAEPQHHARGGERVGLVAAEVPRGVPVAGDLAVEREADGVEHAGLAGPGVAGEQEQAAGGQLVEVDPDRLHERSEGGDRELVQPHRADTTASRPTTRSGSSEQHSSAARRRSDSAARGRRAPDVGHEVERDLVRRAPGGLPAFRCGIGTSRREPQREGVREARHAAVPSPARAATSSVSVAWTQESSCSAKRGSASRSSRVPSSRASRRGTGAVDEARPARSRSAPRSTSHDPLTWSASENE